MILLLPPSEGKAAGGRDRPVDLAALTAADVLTDARKRVLTALVDLCTVDPTRAGSILGLGPRQADDVGRDAEVLTSPARPALTRYTGVLYAALDAASLPAAALRPIRIFSALWGVVAARDRLPYYRLPAGVSLPEIGPVARLWRTSLPASVLVARRGITVDLRSSAYASMWKPSPDERARVVEVRVLTEGPDRVLRTVSHDNKAVKGRLARALLLDPVASVDDVAERAASVGRVQVSAAGRGPRVDVVVSAADLRPVDYSALRPIGP